MSRRILWLECSPYGPQSLGSLLLRTMLGETNSDARSVSLCERNLSVAGWPSISAGYAGAITGRSSSEGDVFALSEQLICELESSDGVVISTPMHNFTIPANLKHWIDLVVRKDRTFTGTPQGKRGLLKDRPVLVMVRSGSPFGEGSRQEDFLTPYLRYVLGVIGIHSTEFVTLPGLAPARELQEAACQQLRQSAVFRMLA